MVPGHLFTDELSLPPSSEWTVPFADWCFVQLLEGQGYWLEPGAFEAANSGEVLVLSPQRQGGFRASALSRVSLRYFRFCPELLSGFLTLAERMRLDQLAAKAPAVFTHLPGDHPAARLFTEASQSGSDGGLLIRCRLLEVAALVFENHLERPRVGGRSFMSASKRTRLFLTQLTEAEVLSVSARELAARCGCSLRHFNRIYQQCFGVSLRAQQTELRLRKARQLLAETTAPVSAVAMACGYRHQSLFNALFRRRFGLTPSAWRQQAQQNSSRSGPPTAQFVTEK